jgi:hypothetical protein
VAMLGGDGWLSLRVVSNLRNVLSGDVLSRIGLSMISPVYEMSLLGFVQSRYINLGYVQSRICPA